MIQTYLVYFGAPLVCGFLSNQATKRNKTIYVWMIIAVLTLVSGLRSYQTGLDTYSYLSKIQLISVGQSELAYGFEESFKMICFLLSRIYNNSTFFLCVFAFITNALIIFRLWDFREISSFLWMVLFYYSCFYFMTMNGIRQFCAVSIVFYFTRYLNQKKLFVFLIGVMIASLFHQSALIGLVFLLEEIRQWRTLNQREKMLLLCCISAMPIALHYIFSASTRYKHYFQATNIDVGVMLPIKILLYLVTLIFMYQIYKRMMLSPIKSISCSATSPDAIPMICTAYILGLLLTMFGYMYAQVERIGWYFYLYEGAYYGILQKDTDKVNKYVFGGCIAILIGYSFIYSILHNSQGNIPYLFFWQG